VHVYCENHRKGALPNLSNSFFRGIVRHFPRQSSTVDCGEEENRFRLSELEGNDHRWRATSRSDIANKVLSLRSNFSSGPSNSTLAMSVKRKSTVPQTGQKKSKIVPNNGPKEGKANKPISKKIEEPELDDLDDEDEFHGFGDDSDENNESNSELEDVESEEENEEEESEGDSADEMVIETSTRPQKSGKDIKPESGTLSSWIQLTPSHAKGSPSSCSSKSTGKGAKTSKAKW